MKRLILVDSDGTLRSRMIDQYTGERVDLKVYSVMKED